MDRFEPEATMTNIEEGNWDKLPRPSGERLVARLAIPGKVTTYSPLWTQKENVIFSSQLPMKRIIIVIPAVEVLGF